MKNNTETEPLASYGANNDGHGANNADLMPFSKEI